MTPEMKKNHPESMKIAEDLLLPGTKKNLEYLKHNDKEKSALQKELQNKINIEKKEELNNLLLKSIEIGDIKIIKSLLNTGANVNIENKKWETPLMLTLKNENISGENKEKIINLLLEKGASIYNKDENSKSVSYYVFKYGSDKIINLVRDFTKKSKDKKELIEEDLRELEGDGRELEGVGKKEELNELLSKSIKNGDIGTINLLLNNGININQENVLYYALTYGNDNVIKLFKDLVIKSQNFQTSKTEITGGNGDRNNPEDTKPEDTPVPEEPKPEDTDTPDTGNNNSSNWHKDEDIAPEGIPNW